MQAGDIPEENEELRNAGNTQPHLGPVGHNAKTPTVRYVDEQNTEGGSNSGYHSRSNSMDMLSSRLASPAATDDDEIYDWSGEEDLNDEQAKFEERMGNTKVEERKGWSFKRSFFSVSSLAFLTTRC